MLTWAKIIREVLEHILVIAILIGVYLAGHHTGDTLFEWFHGIDELITYICN